jgi:hypothetical protein
MYNSEKMTSIHETGYIVNKGVFVEAMSSLEHLDYISYNGL